MTIPAYERRSFSETAVTTTITADISDTDMTIAIAATTGWPTGSGGDFYVRIDNETIRIDTRSTGTLTVLSPSGRGASGTTASNHSSGATIEVVFDVVDADEANYTVAETVGKVTAAGQLLVGDGVNSLTPLNNGTSGLPLVAGASAPSYAQLASGALAADSVGSSQIQADSVGTSEIAPTSVTAVELAADAVTTAKILNVNVTTGKIADAAVTAAKLDGAIAGNGLAGGAGTALSVNVDGSTIEITTDALNVKDGSITQAKLLSGLSAIKSNSASPSGTTDRMWWDADDNLLYVRNSNDIWVCITPQSAAVATSQSTSSTSYGNLGTTGPAVTVNTDTKALVTLTCQSSNNTAGNSALMSMAVSGATTVAASDANMVSVPSDTAGLGIMLSATFLVTGLTPGANVFTSKYRAGAAGTATFARRWITVVGLP